MYLTLHLAAMVMMCSAVCTHALTADSEIVELQTRYLNSIYETVKYRQLKEGELNLLQNESVGFASAIRSFAEKAPHVADGNRAMTFDLSMVTEPKQSQIQMQLVVKIPSLPYFQSVKYLHLYNECPSCADPSQLVASHTVTSTDQDREWLELTIDCAGCDWRELGDFSLALQLTDDSHLPITFNEEIVTGLKSFLVLYTYDRNLFLSESVIRALEKRNPSEATLQNRTTIQELLDRNISCSRHEVLLTTEELKFRGTIVAPDPTGIHLSYCLGHCNDELELSSRNLTIYDSRTRVLINNLNRMRKGAHPPPCCIPSGLVPLELIVIRDEVVVQLDTIPSVVNCKCQL